MKLQNDGVLVFDLVTLRDRFLARLVTAKEELFFSFSKERRMMHDESGNEGEESENERKRVGISSRDKAGNTNQKTKAAPFVCY